VILSAGKWNLEQRKGLGKMGEEQSRMVADSRVSTKGQGGSGLGLDGRSRRRWKPTAVSTMAF